MIANQESVEFKQAAEQLVIAGRFFDQKGWVPATSGNFSSRLSDQTLAVTVSGKHKGCLREQDIMLCDSSGISLDGQTPSAETSLHAGIYQYYPNIQAVMHTHSINSTLLSFFFNNPLKIEGYELLKAFEGIATHEATLYVPIFPNSQDMSAILEAMQGYFASQLQCSAFVLAGHGLYTFASSIEKAVYQVEALEFLFECELRRKGAVGL